MDLGDFVDKSSAGGDKIVLDRSIEKNILGPQLSATTTKETKASAKQTDSKSGKLGFVKRRQKSIDEYINASFDEVIPDFINQNAPTHTNVLNVDQVIFQRLFDHQIVGINFLYANFKKKRGCILADDMGLGKTVQISTFLSSLRFESYINKALIVVPATLLDYWESEIHRWSSKKIRVLKINGSAK